MNEVKSKKKNAFSLVVRDSVKLFAGTSRKKRTKQLPPVPLEGQQAALPIPKEVTAKDEEEWNIKSLPSDWQPNLKPSRIIAQLREKKRRQHEEALKEMETRISQVNTSMEGKIRQVTVIYKEALIRRSKDVEETLKPIRVERRGELQFTPEYFDELINKVSDVSDTAKSKLYQMMDDLTDLEVERTDEFKDILKDACDKLNEISHQLPFELQEYFEKRIQDINEITMNNMRCYADLKAHLQLHLKNELRLQLQEIQSAKDHWIDFVNASAIQKLNETKLHNVKCSQVLLKSEAFKAGKRSGEIETTRPHGIPLDEICKWLQEVDTITFELDGFAKELLHTFKVSIAELFQINDLNKLAEKIAPLKCTEFTQGQRDSYEPLLLHTATKYNQKLQNIQKSWTTAQEGLLGHVQDTFAFLYRMAHISNGHQSRLQDIETLVLKDLQRLEKLNDGLVCADEIRLNTALDGLRQESELESMGASMRQVQTTLAHMEKVYHSNFEKESKLLQKARDLVDKETDLLVHELEQFLSIYSEYAPTEADACEKSYISNEFSLEEEQEEKGLLSSQIETCRKQIEKLKTWRRELYQAIDYYFDTCREHNLKWAHTFIESQTKELEEILTNMLTFLCESKYDRIKATIYDLRAAEIEKHEARLQRHKEGIEKQMEKNISEIFPKYAPKYDSVLSAYDEDVTNLTIKVVTARNLEMLMMAQASLRSSTENCKKKLEDIEQEYQNEYLSGKSRISLANINYIKALLFFTDGGNFSPQEAKSTCAEIAKLEKIAKKKVISPIKASKSKYERSLQEVQTKHQELQTLMKHHTEELQFSNEYKTILKDLQAGLVQETFAMKFKRNQTIAFVSNAREIQEKYLGVPSCLKVVLDLFNGAIENFQEYLSVISRPELRNYGNYVAKNFLKATSETTRTKKTTDISSVSKSLLFDVKPEVELDFISKSQDLVYTSYDRVHTCGADFYSGHMNVEFQRKGLLHPGFEDYIIEMLPKHIYFYLQCEMAWLKEAHDFIEMLEDFFCYLREYCNRRFVREYANNCVHDLQQAFRDIYPKVDGQAKKNEGEFFKIHRKLKALHGYPGNKSKLDDLTLEMDEFFENKIEESESFFLDVRADLENKRELFREKITELDSELRIAKQIYFDKSLNKGIVVQYEATVDYLKTILDLKYVASSTQDVENVSLKMRVLQQLDLLTTNLSLPFDDVPKVDSFWDDNSLSSTNAELDCLIQKYDEEMEVIFAEVNSMREKDKETVEGWKDMWVLDIIKIARLYDVKYNLPNVKDEVKV